ncbi:MAG: hypothetical protein V7784_07650, partial [Oceanospirillaceae bacterium]
MSEQPESIKSVFKLLLKRPKMLITLLMLYLGVGMVYLGITKAEITPLLSEYGIAALGGLLVFVAMILQFEDSRRRREELDERVSSVDERRREITESETLRSLWKEIKNVKETQQVDYDKIETIISKSEQSKNKVRLEQY